MICSPGSQLALTLPVLPAWMVALMLRWVIGPSWVARTESGAMSALVTAFSAISEEVTELGPRSLLVSESGATLEEETAFSAISSGPAAFGARSSAVSELSATFGELTAPSWRSTVRTVPSTIWAERTLSLATPAAMALPVRARSSAKQLITRAGEGRNERVLLVIGGSFRCLWIRCIQLRSDRPFALRTPGVDLFTPRRWGGRSARRGSGSLRGPLP